MSGTFTVILKLLAVFALVFANGFFVVAEFALVSVRRTRIEELIAQGNTLAKVVRRAIDDPDRFIAATQLGITIASLGLGWIGEATIADLIEPLFHLLPSNFIVPATHTISTAIAFAMITFLHVVLGELAPKSVALQYPERAAFLVARPIIVTENIFRPLIWLLNGSGNLMLRLVGLRPPSGHERVHSVEELKLLLKASHEEGVLPTEQKEMLHKVFDFGNRQVHETMTPRPDIVAVDSEATIDDLLQIFAQSSHARFPVYAGNIDNVTGFVPIKDVLMALAKDPQSRQKKVKTLVRPALFVPESKEIADLFREMRQQQIQIAIIIDEYGGTAGTVTLEELLEEIVGRLSDELVVAPEMVETIDERTVQVDALMRIDEANEELELALPESDEYETIAGLILYRLRRIPKEGDWIQEGDFRLTVQEMEGPKIEKVLITKG